MQQLMSILGTETSTLEARRLLFKAGGDIERALNLHYNDSEAEAAGELLSGTAAPCAAVTGCLAQICTPFHCSLDTAIVDSKS